MELYNGTTCDASSIIDYIYTRYIPNYLKANNFF